MKTRNHIITLLVGLPIFGAAAGFTNSGGYASYASQTSHTSDASPADSDSIHMGTVIDEVIWVVGDEAILKSDVETYRMQAAMEGMKWNGDPDCMIPEQIAVQKLFKHQAQIDSIEVTDADVAPEVEQHINYWLEMVDGSRERLEEYRHKPLSQIRNDLREELKDRQMVQKMKMKLVEDIAVTPAEVRRYFKDMPQDSLPFIPTEVEVEIVQNTPKIPVEELNRVKDELREYTDRVNRGDASFSTLARLYSEDPGTARRGGELGFSGRGMLDPAFAQVAFNLTDPKKVSKIVESEFGYHIIQLIDKRGDKINVRHILLRPKVAQDDIDAAEHRLDSIRTDIVNGKFTFEAGASYISDDKDTKNNQGLMSNSTSDGMTSRFQMKELPTEIARVVDTMKVGEISAPFTRINNKNKTVACIIKLKSRVEGHRATITEDFQVMKDVVLAKEREKVLNDWVVDKIKHTYVRVNDRYKDCKFQYQGWIR